MLHALRSRLAESMIETIVSITVIALASAATLSMLRTSLLGNNVIGEKLVAIELAMEGLDAVKNIRDTNYLLFASDPDTCWDKLNLTLASDCATITTEITDGREYYFFQIFDSDPLYRWTLLPTASSATKPGWISLFDFETDSTTGATVPFYSDWHNAATAGFTANLTHQFERTITVDRHPEDSDGTDLCADGNCYQATVTVTYTVGALTQSVSLSRLITNVY